jgi:glycosyltransferase involved in cell wall biosynthesis
MANNYNKKIKILYIHHGTGIGGAPISLLNLIKYLDKRKYKVKVAFLVGGIHEKMFIDAGIKTEVIGCSNKYFIHNQSGKIQWYYFYRYFAILYHWINTAFIIAPKYLKNQSFNIIHLNSHALTSWAFAAHRIGSKVIMHNREAIAHGYFGIRYTILKSLIKHYCDHVINISEDNKKRLGLKNKSSVVYNFVETPKNYRILLSNNASKVKVLYLGGTAKIKGFETVIKCLPYIVDNITIQIAGNINTFQKSKSLKRHLINLLKKYDYSIFHLK